MIMYNIIKYLYHYIEAWSTVLIYASALLHQMGQSHISIGNTMIFQLIAF